MQYYGVILAGILKRLLDIVSHYFSNLSRIPDNRLSLLADRDPAALIFTATVTMRDNQYWETDAGDVQNW